MTVQPSPVTTSMTVIVKNDVCACFPTGQVVINLSRHAHGQRKKKMDLALSTFRGYGWEIDDQRQHNKKEAVNRPI